MLLIATLGILTQSVGCGMNTTIDDSAYRPVGATQPVNVRAAQPQAASTKASKEHPEYTADGLDLNTNKRRFGFGLNIERIVRTAEIHCKPKHFPSAIEGQGLEACHYQFPRYCGAHSFTVLKAPNQAALIFHDKSSNRVIWDTFRDNHLAQPGLWDLADKLSVATPYPEQQIQAQLAEPDWRGWEVAMNLDDRKRFGAAYAAAINQVLACF